MCAESAAAPASSEVGGKVENEAEKEDRKRPREEEDHSRRRDNRGQ